VRESEKEIHGLKGMYKKEGTDFRFVVQKESKAVEFLETGKLQVVFKNVTRIRK